MLRLGLAAIMLAHGYQKLVLQGGGSFTATQNGFAQMGVPLPQVAGIVIIILELAGGLAMVFGLLTVVVGICYAAAMAVAIWYVHLSNGFFVADNGYEFAGLTGIVALVLAISGAGRHLPGPRDLRRQAPPPHPRGPRGRRPAALCTASAQRAGAVQVRDRQRRGSSTPRSCSGRGPKIRRSASAIATSLMLASRRRIRPCSSNSQFSLP